MRFRDGLIPTRGFSCVSQQLNQHLLMFQTLGEGRLRLFDGGEMKS
jgi:hypothetical protein